MPTLRVAQVTHSQEAVLASHHHCPHCLRDVLWMITYLGGRPLPFNPRPLSPRRAPDGWAPGMFPIGGRQRLCMAPTAAHDPPRRFARVHTVHHCQEAA